MSSFGKIKKGDIYKGEDFYDAPYTQTDKFNVYIPKQKDNIMQLISKDQSKTKQEYSRIPTQQLQQQQRPASQGSQSSSFKKRLIGNVEDSRAEQVQSEAQASQQQYQQLQKSNSQSQLSQNQQNRRLIQSQQGNRNRSNQFSRDNLKSSYQIGRSTGYTQKQDELKKTQQKLRSKLYFEVKTRAIPKSTVRNDVIENICQDPYVFMKNKQLMSSVYKLKSLNLLKQRSVHVNQQPGVGKFDFVLNDFHSKSTNNGFSRNDFGGFYTR